MAASAINFLMQELNNDVIANHVSDWLSSKKSGIL